MLHSAFENGAVLHHRSWVETYSNVLMLVWVDRKTFWRDIECKTFTLWLRPRLNCELDSTRNLVRIDNLEPLLCTLSILLGNQGSEPEQLLLYRVNAGWYDCLCVNSRIKRGDNCLLFKDLVEVSSVYAWDRALCAELELDTFRVQCCITVCNVY
jgi:hypothetical protein